MGKEEEERKLNALKEDCLRYVFNFLNFGDKINFGLACKQCHEIARSWVRTQRIDMREVLSCFAPKDVRTFFRFYGQDITSIFVPIYTPDIEPIKQLCHYSPNVESLSMVYLCTGLFPNLMSSVEEQVALMDAIAQEVSQLKQLKDLNMQSTPTTGKYLCELTQLIELNLACCRQLDTNHFIKILEANPNLKKVIIANYCKVEPPVLACLVETQKKLEALALDADAHESWDFMPRLRALKHISITDLQTPGRGPEKLLRVLGDSHPKTLETLECWFWTLQGFAKFPTFKNLKRIMLMPTEPIRDDLLRKISRSCHRLEKAEFGLSLPCFTPDGLIDFIHSLTHLKYLYLRICHIFNVDLYMRIYRLRKKMGSTQRLIISCGPGDVFDVAYVIVKSENFAEQRKLVDLELRETNNIMGLGPKPLEHV